jgi:hypothetical protein
MLKCAKSVAVYLCRIDWHIAAYEKAMCGRYFLNFTSCCFILCIVSQEHVVYTLKVAFSCLHLRLRIPKFWTFIAFNILTNSLGC